MKTKTLKGEHENFRLDSVIEELGDNTFTLESVGSLMLVDKNFRILYNSRIHEHADGNLSWQDERDYLHKNLFEVYPSIQYEDSTFTQCMRTARPVIRKNQKILDFKGKYYVTNNVTIPIIKEGILIGAVELVKDVTTVRNLNDKDAHGDLKEQTVYPVQNFRFADIITDDAKMKELIRNAMIYAHSPNPVLICGETGTGKEVFAQAMIQSLEPLKGSVIVQNCAAIPSGLMESILFGTTKGAFTGAEDQKGLFELADQGVLFLDEFLSIPYEVQGKLLRVLQDGTFRSIGGDREKSVQVKIIATINVDPLTAIREKKLREDLFYRLSSHTLMIPPLRERDAKDIHLFLTYYLQLYNQKYRKNILGFHEELEHYLMSYKWKGNVRELMHLVEGMVSIRAKEILEIDDLPAYLVKEKQVPESGFFESSFPFDLKSYLLDTESNIIEKALEKTSGNVSDAAKLLGLPRQTLYSKLKKIRKTILHK